MSLFRSGPSPHQTALAMVGTKPGKTAVVIGAADGALSAELALITGLNGQTIVVSPEDSAESVVAEAAAKAGALVEFVSGSASSTSLESGSSDVVVINGILGGLGDTRAAAASEAVRLIRPGGRIVVLERRPRKSWFAGLGRSRGALLMTGDDICAALLTAGLRAVRILAETDDAVFVEGVKARPEKG